MLLHLQEIQTSA